MADKKISQLTAATTPLAGSEELPIVQSGETRRVTSDNLTVKNVRSNATTGILQVAGPAASATRTMTTPDANFTVARTDAGQTFTGAQTIVNETGGTTASNYLVVKGSTADNSNYPAIELQGGALYQAGRAPKLSIGNAGLGVGLYAGYLATVYTAQYGIYLDSSVGLQLQSSASGAPVTKLSLGTGNDVTLSLGNLIIGTAGKGIDFSATASGSGTMTSELLADYEEGTFSPTVVGSTSAGTATYGSANGRYTKVGRIVEFEIYLDWTGGTGTGNLLFGGLPFTANASLPYASVSLGYLHNFNWAASTFPMALVVGTQVEFFVQTLGGGSIASMAYSANGTVYVSGTYTV